MKKIVLVVVFTLMCSCIFSQEDKNVENKKSDVFTSKTGVLIKFIDYILPDLHGEYHGGGAATRIRKFNTGGMVGYFYVISYNTNYDTKKALIAYDDLMELIKATKKLKEEADKDTLNKDNYMENKFITSDGFQVGYYILQGIAHWYITLEKYGSDNTITIAFKAFAFEMTGKASSTSDNTIFVKDFSEMETAFVNAKARIEELKQQESN